ncbi:MAG: hypothetical protein ACXW5U_05070 [Thermoanaerobaculia bacterium]
MAVTLHIDELVLDGFDARDSGAIGDALRTELARLAGSQTDWRASSADRIDGGDVGDARSGDVGARVARAIHRGVTGGATP